jgi:dihydropyrimidinase
VARAAFNDLQVISTDHCPFCMKEQKELGRDDFSKIPNGAPGRRDRMSSSTTAASRRDASRSTASSRSPRRTPAKIFGLFPRKGTIAVGSDADIVIFDPERSLQPPQVTPASRRPDGTRLASPSGHLTALSR